MHLGTEAHKKLFCHSFIDTHRPYDPHQLPWPELNEHQLQVLRGIPFWGEALKVETNAGMMGAAWWRSIQSLYYYGRAIHRLVGSLQTGNKSGPGFTANGAATLGLELTPTIFVNTCLEENQRRVSIMAGELLRPRLLPALFGRIQLGLQLGSPARLRQRVSA